MPVVAYTAMSAPNVCASISLVRISRGAPWHLMRPPSRHSTWCASLLTTFISCDTPAADCNLVENRAQVWGGTAFLPCCLLIRSRRSGAPSAARPATPGPLPPPEAPHAPPPTFPPPPPPRPAAAPGRRPPPRHGPRRAP